MQGVYCFHNLHISHMDQDSVVNTYSKQYIESK
jgi:hypothetical protein